MPAIHAAAPLRKRGGKFPKAFCPGSSILGQHALQTIQGYSLLMADLAVLTSSSASQYATELFTGHNAPEQYFSWADFWHAGPVLCVLPTDETSGDTA